jgi:hypothetical protein
MKQRVHSSQKQSVQIQKKTAPLGVKIISILNWIGAVSLLLGAFVVMVPGFLTMMSGEEGAMLTGIILVVLGLMWVVFGIFVMVIARGLWKGKNWTRITEIVLGGLGILNAFWTLISPRGDKLITTIIISVGILLVNGIIVAYLMFNNKVKTFFKK